MEMLNVIETVLLVAVVITSLNNIFAKATLITSVVQTSALLSLAVTSYLSTDGLFWPVGFTIVGLLNFVEVIRYMRKPNTGYRKHEGLCD